MGFLERDFRISMGKQETCEKLFDTKEFVDSSEEYPVSGGLKHTAALAA